MSPSFERNVDHARIALENARRLLHAEISAYPAPIAGCDEQFNHLLAERQKVIGALDALREPVFIPTPRMPKPMDKIESR